MNKINKLVLYWCLLLMVVSCRGSSIDLFVDTLDQRQLVEKWVILNSKKGMTIGLARRIVLAAYINAEDKKIDPLMLVSIMRQESTFNPRAKSNHGALGLMQVMPRWHKDKLKKRNPYSVDVSIEVGTIVYRDCLLKHKQDNKKALLCYSGGAKKYPKSVAEHYSALTKFINENDVQRYARLSISGY